MIQASRSEPPNQSNDLPAPLTKRGFRRFVIGIDVRRDLKPRPFKSGEGGRFITVSVAGPSFDLAVMINLVRARSFAFLRRAGTTTLVAEPTSGVKARNMLDGLTARLRVVPFPFVPNSRACPIPEFSAARKANVD